MSALAELELEAEPRVNPWIGSIYLDDKPVNLANVLASVTIRHGREDPDGPIQASTADVKLKGVARSSLVDFEVGHVLTIRGTTADLSNLFQGRLTDATIDDDGGASEAVASLIAVSPLADAGGINVGGHAWPAEPWASRVGRILNEAGLWGAVDAPSPDVPIAATKPSDPETGAFASLDALAALEAARDDVGATVWDDGNGTIIVQAFEARGGLFPLLELPPSIVLYSPPWSQTLAGVRNRIVLGYGYGAGSVTVDDHVSQSIYGVRWTGLFDSGIADQAHALERASEWLNRLAYPKWALPGVTLLEPQALAVGMVVELTELPDSAPFATWRAVVEGWVDTIEGPDWTQDLILSDPQLSGLALPWQELPPALQWQAVKPTCRWRDAFYLGNLTDLTLTQEAA